MNLADQVTVGRKAVDAVVAITRPARARPNIAVQVGADAVGHARRHVDKDLVIAQVTVGHVEDADMGWAVLLVRDAGVYNVEFGFVRRKAETVGLGKITGDHRGLATLRIDAIDIGGQFKLGACPFVVEQDAIARVGKPDAAVRMDDNIVGRVEALALVAVHQTP